MKPITEPLYIPSRFCGFDGSGNGGYVCGRIAEYMDVPAEVTLKKPMPLETEIAVVREDNGNVRVEYDGKVYGTAHPVEFDIDVPSPPTLEQAQAASEHYAGKIAHPAPRCFVCGPERTPGDGLCIYPVRIPGRNYTAAPWQPEDSLLDESGIIRPEFIWAALDCPGGLAAAGEPIKKVLLGRLAAKQLRPHLTLAPYIAVGWVIASEGRKHHTGTALFTAAGELCAYARAIWIGFSH